MKLVKLHEHDSDAQWITPADMTDSDWPVRFIVRLQFMEDYGRDVRDAIGLYHIEIHAVSPEAARPYNLERCAHSMGFSPDDFKALPRERQCSEMVGYGLSACIWQRGGNNRRELERAARKELGSISTLFGIYMDRPLNAVGGTGRDFIRGECWPRRGEEEAEAENSGTAT